MGCDIHATLEYDPYAQQMSEQGRPPYFQPFATDIYIDRNYRLFHYLGLVSRGPKDAPVIAELRGIPENASFEYQKRCQRSTVGVHSHSYLYADELKGIHDQNKEDDWYLVVRLLADKYGERNVRLCFFFDS